MLLDYVEFIYFSYLFSHRRHIQKLFHSCRPFLVNTTFSAVIFGVLFLKLQHPKKKPVENVVLTTKGLQERKTTIEWDDGKNK
jgi:hypothetical protein